MKVIKITLTLWVVNEGERRLDPSKWGLSGVFASLNRRRKRFALRCFRRTPIF